MRSCASICGSMCGLVNGCVLWELFFCVVLWCLWWWFWVALRWMYLWCFFFQAEDGIRDLYVTGVQTCALPIFPVARQRHCFATAHPRRGNSPGPLAGTRGASLARGGLDMKGCCAALAAVVLALPTRSEERRVGKECRARRAAEH